MTLWLLMGTLASCLGWGCWALWQLVLGQHAWLDACPSGRGILSTHNYAVFVNLQGLLSLFSLD